ncbi:MAG TPA: hypothetical protein VFS00_22110 [Polyangiaceae bacterium]|nr:hypothetical protein [Polyangiaceae bacterium]
MKLSYAEGPTYSISLEDGVASCRIWSRPDIEWAEGARVATDLTKVLLALAEGPREQARALVFDEREAPPVFGPQTEVAVGSLLAAWERQERRVASAVGTNPVKQLQMRRLLAERAPKYGRAFLTFEEALAWARG